METETHKDNGEEDVVHQNDLPHALDWDLPHPLVLPVALCVQCTN